MVGEKLGDKIGVDDNAAIEKVATDGHERLDENQSETKEELDAKMKENKGTVESDVKCFDGDVATEVVEEGEVDGGVNHQPQQLKNSECCLKIKRPNENSSFWKRKNRARKRKSRVEIPGQKLVGLQIADLN